MARVATRCPACGQEAEVESDVVLIDDENDSYTFSCPHCSQGVRKVLDAKVRSLLRGVGVSTLEEVVESAMVVVEDERAMWKELLR